MNIKQTFLKLTERTYPHGFEDGLISYLPSETIKDEDGNYYFEILGKDNQPTKTIFTCHLDTACKSQVEVRHVEDGNYIKTDGKSILGADDKAGMTILLWMIEHNIPGLYYFFIGEEVGCIGSRAASCRKDFFQKYERMISFDRRGTTSVITHQSSRRTCSDLFATELGKQISKFSTLSLRPDDTGVYTDSAEFASVIPECTNISVGYNKEHTTSESQDIHYLEKLCYALLRVDWEKLPVGRVANTYEYKSYRSYGGYYDYDYGYLPDNSYPGKWHRDSSGYSDMYPSKKKTRRGGRKSKSWMEEDLAYGYMSSQPDYYFKDGRKVYYDSNKTSKKMAIPLPGAESDHYACVRDMYLDPDITQEELRIIKEDFLDPKSKDDMMFANYMSTVF